MPFWPMNGSRISLRAGKVMSKAGNTSFLFVCGLGVELTGLIVFKKKLLCSWARFDGRDCYGLVLDANGR